MSFDINYANEEEVIQMVISSFFHQKIHERVVDLFNDKALELMGFEDRYPKEGISYGGFSQHYRVACGHFRSRQICGRDIRSASDADRYVEALALEAVQNTYPLLDRIINSGGKPSLGWLQAAIDIKWRSWNEYDALCNPELLKPYWKMFIKITWHHPDDLASV